MLKELFTLEAGDEPIAGAQAAFLEMLHLCEEMVATASAVFWGAPMTKEERKEFYKKDVRINKLERQVRVAVVTHLAGSSTPDLPYALMLISLVKDLERLGDHAKNLSEAPRMSHGKDTERELPNDEIVAELRRVSRFVEELSSVARQIYTDSDLEAAKNVTLKGRENARALDELVSRVAASNYNARIAVDLTLAARFYKRIQGHLLNLLSSVLMPLHKLDYFDEDEIQPVDGSD